MVKIWAEWNVACGHFLYLQRLYCFGQLADRLNYEIEIKVED